ncbi:hypothetical protein WMY93_016295 [Mugilogobius chulae]|uniref:SCP domain-containing protein n=1 Tax=Mugilogobius chulae TaxID=88201 RepID=A0AAW0NWX1_9GOBI
MWSCLLALGLVAALQVPCLAVTSSESREIVDKHNELRRKVRPTASDMQKMSWNSGTASSAQRVANACTQKHSSTSCGENLYMSTNKKSWSAAIQKWYDEVSNWRYGVGSYNGKVVGHFTQVVWAKSNTIGCGMAYCPNQKYKYYYVCQYCPAGNYGYARPYTPGKACASCSGACDDGLCLSGGKTPSKPNPVKPSGGKTCPKDRVFGCSLLVKLGCGWVTHSLCPTSCCNK